LHKRLKILSYTLTKSI